MKRSGTAEFDRTDSWCWHARAGVCDCHMVALTLLHRSSMDLNAVLDAEDAHEICLMGNDWRVISRQVLQQMAERTGLPISYKCTVVVANDATLEREIEQWWAANVAPDSGRGTASPY